MKRVVFYGFALALSVLVLKATAQQGKPSKDWPVVRLDVVIEDVDSLNSACSICSDGNGAYVDGADGVSASFDQWGNLIIDFGTRTVSRGVEFTFADPDLPSGVFLDSYVATRGAGLPLQNLQNNESVCAQMNWAFRADTEYRLLFQRSDYAVAEDSAWAFVSRVDDDTWTLEPRGMTDCDTGQDSLATIVSLSTKGKQVTIPQGSEVMPFSLTLRRLPQ